MRNLPCLVQFLFKFFAACRKAQTV